MMEGNTGVVGIIAMERGETFGRLGSAGFERAKSGLITHHIIGRITLVVDRFEYLGRLMSPFYDKGADPSAFVMLRLQGDIAGDADRRTDRLVEALEA